MAVNNDYPLPPQNPRLSTPYLRELMNGLIGALKGKLNNCGEITLTAAGTTTTIKDKLCNENSVILLTPLTLHASADIGAGTIYVTPGDKQFVINHAVSVLTDRTFRYVIFG